MEDLSSSKEKIQLLLNREHLPPIVAISKENGGKNNRVFSVTLDNEIEIIAKFYYYSEADKRDRFSHETNFLTFANARGIDCVSKIIASSRDERLCLFTKLPGQKLKSDEINEIHVNQAADFIINLNFDRHSLGQLQKASDACMRLDDHLDLASRRINALIELKKSGNLNPAAIEFLDEELLPKWEYELNDFHKKISKLKSEIPSFGDEFNIILSPSDFGFHNILMSQEKLFFLDFEYAGLDDCAKLVCDFLLSPDIQIPTRFHSLFIKRIQSGLALYGTFIETISILKEIHRIKWVCVLLNEFTTSGHNRRIFANAENSNDKLKQQLMKATKLLNASNERN